MNSLEAKLERKALAYERSINEATLRYITIGKIMKETFDTALKKPIKVKFKAIKKSKSKDNYVFVTSDFHYNGDETLLEHFNTVYNHILAKQKEFGFTNITLLELGDTIDGGSLRTSQLMAIKKGMVFQIIDVAKAYADLVTKLSETMTVDFWVVTSSNHTQIRPLGTERNELVDEDLMYVFASYVATATKGNKRIKVSGGKDFIIPVTPKHKMFVAHGHLVGNKKEGYLQELAYHRGVNFEYGLFGHYHHYREVTLYEGKGCNKKVFYAPSMSTVKSTYENDRNMSSHPGMLLMVFNAERGHRYCEELFIK
jgi:hypothetical protein